MIKTESAFAGGEIETFYKLNEETLSGKVVEEVVEDCIQAIKNRLPNKMICRSVITIITERLLEKVNDTEVKL